MCEAESSWRCESPLQTKETRLDQSWGIFECLSHGSCSTRMEITLTTNTCDSKNMRPPCCPMMELPTGSRHLGSPHWPLEIETLRREQILPMVHPLLAIRLKTF